MKLSTLMTANALIFIGFGIAFALYGPLMVAMFGGLDTGQGDAVLYWYAVSFARLFGAVLFGFGFLILAARPVEPLQDRAAASSLRRGVVFSLLLANLMGLFVAGIQQYNIWQSISGWITLALFLVFVLGYGYFLVRASDDTARPA